MLKKTFQNVGKFPDDWPLLEDVSLVDKLRWRCGPPAIIPRTIQTSGRRWREMGLLKTTLINQAILIGYTMGVDVHELAGWYERTGPRKMLS